MLAPTLPPARTGLRRILHRGWTTARRWARFDFNVTTATFQNRSRAIGRTIRYELYALPIFALMGWLVSPIFHLLYGVLVGCVLAYQMWCVAVMYALAVLNLQFASIVVKALHKLMAVANILPATINEKADEIKTQFEEILKSETGDLAAGMNAFVKAVMGILKIPTAMTETIITGLDQFITDVQIQIAAVPDGISRRAHEQVGPVIYKLMSLQWWVLVISGVFWLLPWWRNPTAAVFLIAGGVLILLLMPSNVKPNWSSAWPGITKVNKWLAAGAIVSLALAYSGNNICSRPEIIALSLGLPLVVILPQLLGIRMSMSVAVLGIGIWGLTMPEHWVRLGIVGEDTNHTMPRYYRTVHVGGMPKFYQTRPVNPAKQVGSWWSRSHNDFRPKRNWQTTPSEQLDFNTMLYRLEDSAEKDISGGLWIKVVPTNGDNLPSDETPFYVPLRGDFVEEIPPPGTPVELVTTATFDPEAGYHRLEERNTLELLAFCRKKFGRSFQYITWLGYEPVYNEYQDPLPRSVVFEIGAGFESAMNDEADYSGVDLVCPIDQVEVPVLAAGDGEIAGLTLNTYMSVTIKHQDGDGLWTHYGRLSKIASRVGGERLHFGQAVKKGEVIGYIQRGQKFHPYGGKPYLYFACIRKQGNGIMNPVDPLPILGRADYPTIPGEQVADPEEIVSNP